MELSEAVFDHFCGHFWPQWAYCGAHHFGIALEPSFTIEMRDAALEQVVCGQRNLPQLLVDSDALRYETTSWH
jgi:hypothetical protein